MTKDKFSDKPDLPTVLSTLEAMKSHDSMYGISTIAIPKIGCGLDKMNWQDVVKLLRDVFAYSDIHIVVYTLESHGVHALLSEGDPEFYAEDEIERYSEEVHLNVKILKQTLPGIQSRANLFPMNSFLFSERRKETID